MSIVTYIVENIDISVMVFGSDWDAFIAERNSSIDGDWAESIRGADLASTRVLVG